jgi:hypothetical protein
MAVDLARSPQTEAQRASQFAPRWTLAKSGPPVTE